MAYVQTGLNPVDIFGFGAILKSYSKKMIKHIKTNRITYFLSLKEFDIWIKGNAKHPYSKSRKAQKIWMDKQTKKNVCAQVLGICALS